MNETLLASNGSGVHTADGAMVSRCLRCLTVSIALSLASPLEYPCCTPLPQYISVILQGDRGGKHCLSHNVASHYIALILKLLYRNYLT
ncbi:hypothetical protein E2C01_043840 [Portunus trituberculatus]|uniref:Uncharacterized protein n=1 Tax=Portunus trituberculatus TaxID=210409 RepID=A0A5B7FRC1_PORTR|nr:hypothetical protein [Portunus trituberculatus]